MRKLPTITDEQKNELALGADNHSISGKQIGTIAYAVFEHHEKTGSHSLRLGIKAANGNVYEPTSNIMIMESDTEIGKYREGYGRLLQLFEFTNTSDTVAVKPAPVRTWDADQKKFVDVMTNCDQFVELIGKKIGFIMQVQQKYPNSKGINGYTGIAIPDKQSDPAGYENARKDPATIWVTDYSKKTVPVFSFPMFFHPVKMASKAELVSDAEELKDVTKAHLKAIEASNKKPVIVTNREELDKFRLSTLKKQLKYKGVDFIESKFIASTSDATYSNSNDNDSDTGSDLDASDLD